MHGTMNGKYINDARYHERQIYWILLKLVLRLRNRKNSRFSVGILMHDGLKRGKKTQVQGHCDCIVNFLHSVDYRTKKEQIMHVHFDLCSIHVGPITICVLP
jgi:hypothetical protein